MVKDMPANAENLSEAGSVFKRGREDPLDKEMATHSSILS